MKTKLVALAAAATALTMGLSGCGSDSSSSSSAKGDGTIASQMIFGGPPEFKTRTDGIPGLMENYGVEFGKYTVTDVGGPVTVNALKRGQVDAADLFTTDPAIEANDLVILEDPKSNFAAQNIVPIVSKDKATDGVTEVLNAVQAKLTTEGLGELIGKVANDKEAPDAVAKSWLSEALKAQGATIQTKLNIGSREKYYPALKAGSLDLFPEYTGATLVYLDKNTTATSPDDVYAALGKALPSNLVALDKAEAQDNDAVVVTQETADKYKLKTIADLAKKG